MDPKQSGRFICERGNYVKVLDLGVEKISNLIYEDLISGKLDIKNFKQNELHPKDANEKAIDWIFFVDTLNFSFWTEDPKWEVKYNDKIWTGYFACCAAVNRAIDEGIDILNPNVYGSFTEDDILKIFRSETSAQIPLVQERISNLREVSQILKEKYGGSFANCVKASECSAKELLQKLKDFPCYRDENVYPSDSSSETAETVTFYKRAQILIGDIWACFEGKGLGQFNDIDYISMFADYRIPQVLLAFDVLEYSPELLNVLKSDTLINNGDIREIEIRGASIHGVELIKEKVREKLIENGSSPELINSILIDHFLWDYRRLHASSLEKYPYHKTRCIFY